MTNGKGAEGRREEKEQRGEGRKEGRGEKEEVRKSSRGEKGRKEVRGE